MIFLFTSIEQEPKKKFKHLENKSKQTKTLTCKVIPNHSFISPCLYHKQGEMNKSEQMFWNDVNKQISTLGTEKKLKTLSQYYLSHPVV